MKSRFVFCSTLLGALLCGCLTGVAQSAPAQSFAAPAQGFAGSAETAVIDGASAALSGFDSLYAEGTRAIDEGRWQDAEAIFAKIAGQHGDHSDGALYWRAYAQNKQGHASAALATCAELGHAFPASSWIHECGALEIEIHAKSGKPEEPKATQDDDLKLLALNSLMQKDESSALAQIQEILNGDSSEKLKKEALFILGHHYSDATYAQIVRISYVEGDVRIARGAEKEKPAGAVWEKAVANLPLETGFSLATGDGRAEIEFEDASTLYLAENSVLTFNDMNTTSGVPYTELALLTGTVSLNVHPYVAREVFRLKTPTDNFAWRYPAHMNGRISSYLDGSAITPVDGGVVNLSEGPQEDVKKGQTLFFREDLRISSLSSSDPDAFADWDKWVADRLAQRTAAMADMMKASGLTSPIPGLADMKGHGTFFECAPYGTCWEPTAEDGQQLPEEKVSKARPSLEQTPGQGVHLIQASFQKPFRFAGGQAIQASSHEPILTYGIMGFPCMPASLGYRILRDPSTGAERIVGTGLVPDPTGWDWAMCHAGSWVHRHHRYCWVAGNKRHHVPPVRWVKSGRKVAIVPIHPFDVKGMPAINLKEEIFAIHDKNGLTVEPVKLERNHTIEELASPPREYRTAYLPPLSRTDAPHMEAHAMKDGLRGGNFTAVKIAGVPLGFNPKSESFTIAKEVMRGNKSVTVSAPITNRGGTLQARGDSFAGGHGALSGGGSRGSGGFSGGSSHGSGSSSGGSSHGGGGSSGGGSHGGGGGASAGSSGSASSGSSASSSGGNHH